MGPKNNAYVLITTLNSLKNAIGLSNFMKGIDEKRKYIVMTLYRIDLCNPFT